MRFESIHIKNYKNIEVLDIYFDSSKIQIILLEQEGKINLFNAMQFCLFGFDDATENLHCDSVDRDFLDKYTKSEKTDCDIEVNLIGVHRGKQYSFLRKLPSTLIGKADAASNFLIEIKENDSNNSINMLVKTITDPVQTEKIVRSLLPQGLRVFHYCSKDALIQTERWYAEGVFCPLLIHIDDYWLAREDLKLLYGKLAEHNNCNQIIIIQNPVEYRNENRAFWKIEHPCDSRIQWIGNFNDNVFSRLIMDAYLNPWCTKIGCSTCGCGKFRGEVKKIDPQVLIKAISNLKSSEFKGLPGWLQCTEVAWGDLSWYLYKSGISHVNTEMPEIVRAVEEHYRLKREAKYKRLKKLEDEAESKRKGKIKLHAECLRRREENRKEREHVLAAFNSFPLERKLETIACDLIHKPDYYNFEFQNLSDSELYDINKETVIKLIDRFSTLKKGEWKDFYSKLIRLREGV